MPSRATKQSATFAALAALALPSLASPAIALADEPPAPPAAAPPSTNAAPAPAPADPADGKPARPPPLPPTESAPLPWERTFAVGGDFAFVARPASRDRQGNASRVRYEAATGFALHIRWPLLEHLQIEGYFIDCHLPVTVASGGLGTRDPIASPPVETFVFGARLSPKITWGRVTASVTAGVGWGRLEFKRMTAATQGGETLVPPAFPLYSLRERGGSFVELPVGFGVSIELVKRWLSLDIQATAAFVLEQHGDAFDGGQTVNASGALQDVGPLPIMDASLVQTIGFSLLL